MRSRKVAVSEMKKTSRKLIIVSFAMIGVIFLAGAVALYYFDSLYMLLDISEITGDPSIPEIDLADPGEIVAETTLATTSSLASLPEASPAPTETTIPTTVMTLSSIPVPTSKNVYNILLIGSDRRENEVTGRSDAMIIFSINNKTRKIHLVSLMRGLYVKIEDHGYSMLNNAYSWGGPRRLLQTIEANLRVKVTDYVVADFSSFTKAIDLIGGIDINLTEAEVKYIAGTYPDAELVSGINHLCGEITLAYTRIRHIDSDYQRTARQRQVITSLVSSMIRQNPGELDAMARQVLPLMKTNVSSSKLIELIINSPQYAGFQVKQLMLPVRGSFETIVVNGIQMVDFDVTENIEALHRFLYVD
jgi:LCP family protein required for cell wall assembly